MPIALNFKYLKGILLKFLKPYFYEDLSYHLLNMKFLTSALIAILTFTVPALGQMNFWHGMSRTIVNNGEGGIVTYDGKYKIHTFNSNGTFKLTSGSGPVEILMVAGGGGGGSSVYGDGGGGATGAGGINIYQHAGGPGGTGLTTNISGYSQTFATGGKGGGGSGTGIAALANTGNGGNGGYSNTYGGKGGSGTLIIRYRYLK